MKMTFTWISIIVLVFSIALAKVTMAILNEDIKLGLAWFAGIILWMKILDQIEVRR